MADRYAILRTAKLKTLGSIAASLAHTYRQRHTPNADPREAVQNEHSHHGAAQVMAEVRELLPEQRRKDAVLAVEYFVGASPEWFEGKSRYAQNEYFGDALKWLKARHGANNVVGWSIHRDESTPHMVAYVVPLDEAGKLNAKRWLGGRQVLSRMQTEFADQVAQRHGLARGIEGSRAHHQTVKEWYAQAQQPTQHMQISPEEVEPKVLRKGFLTSTYESPVMVAQRLTRAVQQTYTPAIKQAQQSRSEARRAREMAQTAQDKDRALKEAQERNRRLVDQLKPVMELAQLSPADYRELMQRAQARVDAIKELQRQQRLQHRRGPERGHGWSR
jgi:hypothetical protein